MTRPIVKIHNTQTDEVIEREMNDAEFAQYEIDQAKFAADKLQVEAQAAAKAELLDRLGITEDEARLLLG
jgi:hypothetical protein